MSSIANLSPFAAAIRRWRPARGAAALTVICKATFDMRSGVAVLADHQEPIHECDRGWDENPDSSVYAAADVCPFKSGVDVVLVGDAFSSEPTLSIATRLTVGVLDKSIEVFADRHFDSEGKLHYGSRITKMSLRAERAAAGANRENAFGISADADVDMYGRRVLPNLQPAGHHVESPGDTILPIGYGPTSSTVGGGLDHSWRHRRLPDDTNPAAFNVAPPDQRLNTLALDQEIVLEGMHPEHQRFSCRMPGIEPRCFAVAAAAAREISLRADTLWIDTSRAICTITWRGQLELGRLAQEEKVFLAMQTPEQPMTWLDVEKHAAENVAQGIQEEFTADIPHIERAATLSIDDLTIVGQPLVGGDALPFAPSDKPRSDAQRRKALGRSEKASVAVPVRAGDRSPAWLQGAAAEGEASSYALRPDAVHSSLSPEKIEPTAAPNAASSPWAQSLVDQGSKSDLGATPGVLVPAVAPAAPAPPPAGIPKVIPPSPLAADKLSEGGSRSDVSSSVSSAAASSKSGAEDDRTALSMHRSIVQLIAFDETTAEKAIGKPVWQEFLAAQKREEDAAPIDFDEEPPPPPEDEEVLRQQILTIMSDGPRVLIRELAPTMRESVDPSGCFVPPVVVVQGRLEFPFDATERLKATVTCVTPLVGDDEELRGVLESVGELLQTPWLERGEEIASRMTERVRAVYSKREHLIDLEQLDGLTERMLLEQRKYQHRTVFGEDMTRALLKFSSKEDPLPVYVPEVIAAEMPMFNSLQARLLTEAHVRQDQYEKHACALKVVGLGRIVELDG